MMGFFFLCVIDGVEDEMAGDPLRGINVDAAGGAGKVLKMIAEKVCLFFFFFCQMDIAADIFWGGVKRTNRNNHRHQRLHHRRKLKMKR